MAYAVTLQLAMQLQKMRHLTVAQAAERLGVPVAGVETACRMLALPMAHEPEPPLEGLTTPSAAARANRPMKR